MTDATWEVLNDLLSPACLRHLLGFDDLETGEPVTSETDVSEQQAAVAVILTRMLTPLRASAIHKDVLRMQVARFIGEYLEEAGSSRATAIRKQAGGVMAPLASGDDVLAEILKMLTDCYALLLLPPASMMLAIGQDLSAVFGYPARRAFERAVLADPDLSRFFPTQDDNSGHAGSYIGPHSAAGLQLWGFAEAIITNAWRWASLDSLVPHLADVAAKADSLVALLRSLAKGDTVRIPVRVALAGVHLPERPLDFESGGVKLRQWEPRDQWLVDLTGVSRGGVLAASYDGSDVNVSYAGDVIVETTMEYRVHLRSLGIKDPWPADLVALREDLHRRIESVRLGLALVHNDGEPILVVPSWTVILDPMARALNYERRDPRQSARLVPQRLTEEQAAEWARWCDLLLDLAPAHTDICIARMLMALGERRMPEDVLIDSVMAWENMFGAQQETTFRVCASLAHMLEEDPEQRPVLLKELKKIYSLRSGVVHGSKSLTGKDSHLGPRALQIALEAYGRLLTHRPDLLAEADGPARSERLLLGR